MPELGDLTILGQPADLHELVEDPGRRPRDHRVLKRRPR